MTGVEIHGDVDSGFGVVRDAFARNFMERGEVGAACSLYVAGRKVVDLWGGLADTTTGRRWARETLQLAFCATKAALALCALRLVERGELDLDAPVASYWPEFKGAGKEEILVRWLLTYRSAMPVVDAELTVEDLLSWDRVTAALAASVPSWEPGSAHGYEPETWGWKVGEVIRRISGRSAGRFFADEVAAPLGLELFIGLPEALESRVSRLEPVDDVVGPSTDLNVDSFPPAVQEIIRAYNDPASLARRALSLGLALDFNDPAVHAAEISAINGITTARSLARMYAAMIGEVDGWRLLRPATLAEVVKPQSSGPDRVLLFPMRYGLGFLLPTPFMPMTGGAGAFGYPGAGGSLGFADVDRQLGFGYVTNKRQGGMRADPRTSTVIDAIKAVT